MRFYATVHAGGCRLYSYNQEHRLCWRGVEPQHHVTLELKVIFWTVYYLFIRSALQSWGITTPRSSRDNNCPQPINDVVTESDPDPLTQRPDPYKTLVPGRQPLGKIRTSVNSRQESQLGFSPKCHAIRLQYPDLQPIVEVKVHTFFSILHFP